MRQKNREKTYISYNQLFLFGILAAHICVSVRQPILYFKCFFMSETEQFEIVVPSELGGKRLDQVLAQLFPDYSRARLQQWNKEGQVLVDGQNKRAKEKLWGGETINLKATIEEEVSWQPQEMPLDIVYEDDTILVINKPAGLVVHPGAGNASGTLVNGLLFYAPELAEVARGGIVHRLDKDTSGLLVVARTIVAQKKLVAMLQEHTVKRQYEAVVLGVMTGGGTIDEPIGRHSSDRTRMAVTMNGKHAITHYRVLERFRGHTHIQVNLETGRTHQIRVHMAFMHYPLVGDPVYCRRLVLPPQAEEHTKQALKGFKRQALHAARLGLEHPKTGEWMEWQVPLAQDLGDLLDVLREDLALHDEKS